MELRQLRYFIAVADEEHFGRAAEKLGMAQPPLSQQIKRLEEEIGVTLLRRTSRRVELTKEGRAFQCVVRKTLANMEQGLEAVRMMSRGEKARLRVGFSASVAHSDFPKVVAAFRRKHPDIVLDLREMHTMEQRRKLQKGDLDAGVLQYFQGEISDLEFHSFVKEPYLLAVRLEHPLAKACSADIRSLHRENIVVYPHTCSTADGAVLSRCKQLGIEPNVVQEAATLQTKLALVASGLGVGFVPRRMKTVCPPEVKMIPFEWKGDPLMSELRVAWNLSKETPELACFLKVVEQFSQHSRIFPGSGDCCSSIRRLTSTLRPIDEKARS